MTGTTGTDPRSHAPLTVVPARAHHAWRASALVAAVLACTPTQPGPPPPPPPLAAIVDAPAPPEDPEFIGVVVASASVDLASQVPGKLISVHAALGERVEAGALLARIEVPTLPAELAAAAAAVASAEAACAEHRLQLADARRQLGHERDLQAAAVSSQHAREQAELAVTRAEASERRLAAQLAERRADVLALQARRSGGEVLAPFAGTLASWYRPAGAVVEVGERLARVAALERLWVRFAVPVGEHTRLRPGDEVVVTPDPGGRPSRAVVRRVAPELDLASQMLLVEAELVGSSDVQAGQACKVTAADAASPAIVVSSAAPPGEP